MRETITDSEYRALAELRYRIRHFVQEGDAAARRCDLEPQQYLLLLAVRGLPQGATATIRVLAERMALRHHSAVELIDRLESRGLVRRSRSADDRREVLVSLTSRGLRLLERVARRRIGELRATGAALADAISALVERKSPRHKKRVTKRLTNPEIKSNARNGSGSRGLKPRMMRGGRKSSV